MGAGGADGMTEREAVLLDRVACACSPSVVWIETAAESPAGGHTHGVHAAGGGERALYRACDLCGGSGVVLREDGLILTNEHVVRDAARLVVVLPDGSRHEVRRIVKVTGLDLAVLQIDCQGLAAAPPARKPPDSGEPVVAVCRHRSGRQPRWRSGLVVRCSASLQDKLDPTRQTDYGRLVESTVHLEPGFSGGPLVNSRGELVGLNVAMIDGAGGPDRRGYAIPLDAKTLQVIEQLVQGWGKPF